MNEFWKVAVGIAGIGAVGAFVFWSLYKDWLKHPALKNILTKRQIFILFLVFLVLTFLFGIAALVAFVMTQSPSRNGPAVVIGPVTEHYEGIDDETLNKILDASTTGNQDSLAAKDQQIEELKAALERANELAAAGDMQAQAALEEARRSGDTGKLQALLVPHADRIQAQSTSEEFLELCREIAAVSFLRGDIQETIFRIETILHARPNDLFALNQRGLVQMLQGELDAAQRSFERILELDAESAQNIASGNSPVSSVSSVSSWQASAYTNLGAVYLKRGLLEPGELDRAAEMFQKSLAIAEKLGHQEGMAINYGNLGVIYWKRGELDPAELDRAEEMHTKALAIQEKLGSQQGVASDYAALGLMHRARGDLDRAEEMHKKSLAIEEQLGRQAGMAREYGNLGVNYYERGELDRADEMYQKALAIFEQLSDKEGMANVYLNTGSIAADRGDLGRARELWTKALDLYAKIGTPHMVEKVQGWLDDLDQGGTQE